MLSWAPAQQQPNKIWACISLTVLMAGQVAFSGRPEQLLQNQKILIETGLNLVWALEG